MGCARAWVLILIAAAGCGRLGFGDDGPDDDPGSLFGDDPVAPGTLESDGIEGMFAYWTFEDVASGGSIEQVTGQPATCATNQCPTVTTGILGMAAQFDGVDDCLHIPSITTWPAEFTISAWVSATTMTGPVVVHEFAGGCPSPALAANNGGVGLVMLNIQDVHNEAWTGGMLSPSWQHVAVRWDGTNQSVYVDGVCQCQIAPTLAHIYAVVETVIGCYPTAQQYYNGAIDEVRLFDRALNAGEIAALGAIDGRPAPAPQACAATCSQFPP